MARDKSKPLSIPLFPQDFIGSSDVMAMTYEQVGCYIFLICIAWQSDPPCTIPADEKMQANLLKLPLIKWKKISQIVLTPWNDFGENRLIQERLRREYDYLTNKLEAASNAGARGGEASAAKRKAQAESNDRSTTVERPLNDRCDSASSGIQPPNPSPPPPTTTPPIESEVRHSGLTMTKSQAAGSDDLFDKMAELFRPLGLAGKDWIFPMQDVLILAPLIDAIVLSPAKIGGVERYASEPEIIKSLVNVAISRKPYMSVKALCGFLDSVWKRCQRDGCMPDDPIVRKPTEISVQKKKTVWDEIDKEPK